MNGNGVNYDRTSLEALARLVAQELEHPEVERRAITRREAAASLGVSLGFFEEHCQPHLKLLRLGRKCLVPISELDRWIDETAQRTLPKDF